MEQTSAYTHLSESSVPFASADENFPHAGMGSDMESGIGSDAGSGLAKKIFTCLFWLLLLAAPFICGYVLYFVTGTDPRHLDAYNTTWNDEVGYFRVIRLLRTNFFPQGMYGFNEDAPSHLAYGPYNIFTYIPYFVLSFVTGISSHNFFYYSNVILAVLAMAFLALVARPKITETLWITAFMASYLIMGRYIWSGMSESSYNFYLIAFTAMALWAVRYAGIEKKPAPYGAAIRPGSKDDAAIRPGDAEAVRKDAKRTKWALAGMILFTFFWNTMRPYYFPLLIIPLYFIWRRRSSLTVFAKIVFSILCVAAAVGSVGLFFFFTNYNVARYFFDSTQTETLRALLGSGSVVTMVRQILRANYDALRDVWGYLRDARWAGVVSLLYYAQTLLLFILFVRSVAAGRRSRRAVEGMATDAADNSTGCAATVTTTGMATDAADNSTGCAAAGTTTGTADSSLADAAAANMASDATDGHSVSAADQGNEENEETDDIERFGAVHADSFKRQSAGARGAAGVGRELKKSGDGRCFVLFAMLAAGAAIYEANVVLYSPVQLHRMMLAVTIVYGLLFIMLGGFEKYINQFLIIVLMGFLLLRAPQNFNLPQEDAQTLSASDEQLLRDTFSMILPLESDPWDNTICKLPEEKALQWEFMLPTYTSLNVCQKGRLTELLETDTLRSKFLLLGTGSDLNEICRAKKYEVVWEGYDRIMYRTR